MRPLPRVHAVTDLGVLLDPDYRIRLAAIAAAGSAVALHARNPAAAGRALFHVAERMVAHARPPEAAVFVSGRPDIARAVGAQGVHLPQDALAPADARTVFGPGWIGASVHSEAEARTAVDEGVDYLIAGTIFPSESHPGHLSAGLVLIERLAPLGVPVIAIGGITPERVAEVKAAGAYGVAAIGALWRAKDSAEAALALLEPWV